MTRALLILLPPSETKSDGGSRPFPGAAPGRWDALAPICAQVQADLVALSSGDAGLAAKALKVSAKLAETELRRNQQLGNGPLKAAAERYTGVLYDGLDAASLKPDARGWLDDHVAVHSALYGIVGAGEPIEAYRLSHDSRIGGETLRRRWREAVAALLAEHEGPLLDLRSKGYVEFGPLSDRAQHAWGDVVERLPDGSTRSLNHFNKLAKGELVRLLAERLATRPEPTSLYEVGEIVADRFEFGAVRHGVIEIVRLAT